VRIYPGVCHRLNHRTDECPDRAEARAPLAEVAGNGDHSPASSVQPPLLNVAPVPDHPDGAQGERCQYEHCFMRGTLIGDDGFHVKCRFSADNRPKIFASRATHSVNGGGAACPGRPSPRRQPAIWPRAA
jgi:hypothetical protein